MFGKNYILLLAILLLSSCSAIERHAPIDANIFNQKLPSITYNASNTQIADGDVYYVVKNDNLYLISKKYLVNLRDIITLNKLKPPYRLAVGQKILIPNKRRYTIKGGDSLSSIAHKFNVSMKELARLNKISYPYLLHEGANLYLPLKRVAPSQGKKITSIITDAAASSLVTANKVADNSDNILPPLRPTNRTIYAVTTTANTQTNTPTQAIKRQEKTISTPSSYKPSISDNGRFIWPVKGDIIEKFGNTHNGFASDGITIATPKNSNVYAARDGVVVYSGADVKGFGALILLRHANNYISAYAYNDSNLVQKGDTVKQGDIIAKTGASGYATSPSLFFQIRQHNKILNPLPLLNS